MPARRCQRPTSLSSAPPVPTIHGPAKPTQGVRISQVINFRFHTKKLRMLVWRRGSRQASPATGARRRGARRREAQFGRLGLRFQKTSRGKRWLIHFCLLPPSTPARERGPISAIGPSIPPSAEEARGRRLTAGKGQGALFTLGPRSVVPEPGKQGGPQGGPQTPAAPGAGPARARSGAPGPPSPPALRPPPHTRTHLSPPRPDPRRAPLPQTRAAYLAGCRAPSWSPPRRAAPLPASSPRRARAALPVPRVAPPSVPRRRHGDRAAASWRRRGRRDEGQARGWGGVAGSGSAPNGPWISGEGPVTSEPQPGVPRGRGAGCWGARRRPPPPAFQTQRR